MQELTDRQKAEAVESMLAGEGPAFGDPFANGCGFVHPDKPYVCTRHRNHPGDHIAHVGTTIRMAEVIARWPK